MSNVSNPYTNPYAPPRAPAGGPPPAWDPNSGAPLGRVDGKALVLPNGATLPPLCTKCAAHSGLRQRNVKFSFVPPWARILGPLIQLIVMKKSRFDVPLCEPCNAQWKKWNLFAWLAILPGALVLAISTAMDSPGPLAAVAFLLMFAMIVAVLVLRRRRIVFASKIDKTHTWLTGIHADAMRVAAGS